MSSASVEVRPTIDRTWLEEAAARDPIAHAFALWDLDRNPGRVRFFSAVEGSTTLGYLLVWLGHPRAPVVHWFGTGAVTEMLAPMLPARPCVAIVPAEVLAAVESARGPGRTYRVLVLVRPPRAGGPTPIVPEAVRRLTRRDVSRIGAWAERQDDPVVAEYPFLDPEAEMVWGAFDRERLVGVARAEVRLPNVWVLGGVFVEPAQRGQGWGRALLAAALRAAGATRAQVALYVREDRGPARGLYESVGFLPVGHRIWVDLGAGIAP